ncbi:MAG: hypothetical protein Salg2KO_06780 [Salibacteraceae bacterium]
MLKQLILLFNLISFIIITAILPADIKIDTKLPTDATFVIDSAHIIEVTISKGNIFGFAKFQHNVPDGFAAHPVETADASFTFADGKVKFIWMAIPEQNDVKISYALVASDGAAPDGVIGGKFSYLEDNERKSYDIPDIPVKVISDEPVVEKIPAMANASRSVTDLGGNEYEVTLTIVKQGIEGFGKLEEYLPEGSEAEVLENNKAVFSQVDEKAKFVWMAVPEEEEVKVSYKVKSDSDISETLTAMQGNFSYLDDNETKTVAILGGAPVEEAAIAQVEEEVPVEEPEVDTPEPEDIAESIDEQPQDVAESPMDDPNLNEEPAVEEEVAEVVVKDKAEKLNGDTRSDESETTASTSKTPPVVPNPDNGVRYKVQIVAGHKVVSKAYISKTYSFKEPFSIENHEGWVKYITGSYDVYKSARDKREALVSANHQFPGPFVTAYNGDERITVQEALMISNQKWYK